MSDSYEGYKARFSSNRATSNESNENSGMRNINWRQLTGHAASRAKDYVATKEYKNTYNRVSAKVSDKLQERLGQNESIGDSEGTLQQGWSQRARQLIQSRRNTADKVQIGVQKVDIFPGWAVRRFKNGDENKQGTIMFSKHGCFVNERLTRCPF
jgi:hypothetical protein